MAVYKDKKSGKWCFSVYIDGKRYMRQDKVWNLKRDAQAANE